MKMEKQSWVCTVVTQISLCLALYVALNIGKPQAEHVVYRGNRKIGGRASDVYFISVAGGFRPVEEQTLLLKMVQKVVKAYNVSFVVNVSGFRVADSLRENVTEYPELQRLPWFTSRTLKGQDGHHFLKQIKLPYQQSLVMIFVDTGLFQDTSSDLANEQLNWLSRTLSRSNNSDWKIVANLMACDNNNQKTNTSHHFESLLKLLMKYDVDAYLSVQSCVNHTQGREKTCTGASLVDKSSCLTVINQELVLANDTINVFLLHRVSSLEIVTYFVNFKGVAMHKSVVQRRGKATM